MFWFSYSSHTSYQPSQTTCLPWISYASQNWCSIHARWSIPYVSVTFFPSLKQNFIAYRSSKVSSRPYCIFEIHQLWQSGFSRVYSNCCCSCSFKTEIMKFCQSSHRMYINNILNFQESSPILNACAKKSLESYWMHHVYVLSMSICIYILLYLYMCIYMYIYEHICHIYIYIYIYIYHGCHILLPVPIWHHWLPLVCLLKNVSSNQSFQAMMKWRTPRANG